MYITNEHTNIILIKNKKKYTGIKCKLPLIAEFASNLILNIKDVY